MRRVEEYGEGESSDADVVILIDDASLESIDQYSDVFGCQKRSIQYPSVVVSRTESENSRLCELDRKL